MKKLLFFIMLVCCLSGFGQEYYYRQQADASMSGRPGYGRYMVTATLKNGDELSLLDKAYYTESNRIDEYIELDSPIESYKIYVAYLSRGVIQCTNEETIENISCSAPSESLSCGGGGGSAGMLYTINPFSITSQLTQSTDCYKDNVNLIVDTSCGVNLEVDKWYYTLPGEAERYLPGYDGRKSININLEDLTNQPENYLNRPTDFRITFKDINIQGVRSAFFVGCSPDITQDPPRSYNPTCGNSVNSNQNTNGNFTVSFERALRINEKLLLQVWERQPNNSYEFESSKVLLNNDLGPFNSYSWPRELGPGTYKIVWQTKNRFSGDPFDDFESQPAAFEESQPFTITAPPTIQVNATPTNIGCGSDTGSILASASGGTGSLRYSINGTSFQTSGLFENLSAGNYTVTVRDSRSCTVESTEVTIQEFTGSVPVVEGDEISSPKKINGNDGSISIIVSGGAGGNSYSWTKDGNPYTVSLPSTGTNLKNLTEGTYTVVATDRNGCPSETETFILTDPEELIVRITPPAKNPLDCFDDKINLNATAEGGYLNPIGGSYTFTWQDADNNISTGETLINIGQGIYTVFVTDNGGNSATDTIEILGYEIITVSYDPPASISCKDGNDGSIDLRIDGGNPFEISTTNPEPYSVIWSKLGDPDFSKTGSAISDLTSGRYIYEIEDSNGCTLDNNADPIFIDEPRNALQVFENISEHVDVNVAGGTNGVLEIVVENNQGDFTTTWTKDGEPFFPSVASTITRLVGLSAGSYNVNIIDDKCTTVLEENIVITEPEPLLITEISVTELSCFEANDAGIEVQVTGGVKEYHYDWKKEANPDFVAEDMPFIFDLAPGTYTVTVTDESGSSVSVTSRDIEIKDIPELLINKENIQPVVCFGDATGAIDINISGGTPPYSYFWDHGITTEDLVNLETGTYRLTVTDANFCEVQESFEIKNIDNQFRIDTETLINVSSYEGMDGSIQLEVNGGSQPYVYEWIRLSDNSSVSGGNQLTNLTADTYQVTIKDDQNCEIIRNYEITQPDIVDVTRTELTCPGDCNAAIALEVNRGNGNFTYAWNTGATTSAISGLCAGTYTVTINGFRDQPLVRTYEVVEPPVVNLELGEDRIICLGQTTELSAFNDIEGLTYEWSLENNLLSTEAIIEARQSGTYAVQITTATGCKYQDTINVTLIDQEIKAEFLTASQVFTEEEFVILDVTYPATEDIQWNLPEEAQIIDHNSDLVQLYFEQPGTYEVEMIATSGDCQDIFIQKILVLEKENLETSGAEIEKQEQNIQEFKLYPNPSNGEFSVNVLLKEQKEISVKIYNLADNALLSQKKASGKKEYEIPFNLNVASGIYAIVLETPYGHRIQKIVIE